MKWEEIQTLNTPSCKRIICAACGSTVIKALRQSKCPNLTQIGHIWRIYGFAYQGLRCVFSFCFCVSLYPVLVSLIPHKDGIKLQIDPYLYYRHFYHCSNFIRRYHAQISCSMFDFKRWPSLCELSTSRLSNSSSRGRNHLPIRFGHHIN